MVGLALRPHLLVSMLLMMPQNSNATFCILMYFISLKKTQWKIEIVLYKSITTTYQYLYNW